MYRVHLTQSECQELNRRTRQRGVSPRVRDRLEMIRLSHAGFSIPRIARHLSIDEQRVRHWIKAYQSGGFGALKDQPHPGRQSALTSPMLEELRAHLKAEERTWTSRQIAEWLLAQHGVKLGIGWLSRRLRGARLSYKRTTRTLKHKQDSEQVELKAQDLQTLEKGGTRA